jgi:serine protease Do
MVALLLLAFLGNPAIAATTDDSAVLNQAAGVIHTVAKRAMPAVVSITTIKDSDPDEDTLDTLFGSGLSPFDLFGQGGPGEPSRRTVSLGSGVIIDPSGLVLTNQHVIENAERITVAFDDRHKSPAVVVGSDTKTDVAVIKIKDKSQLPPISALPFGDSDQVKVGDWAIAVGSPFGLKQSVTVGIVSATGRSNMGGLEAEDFIQTDAAINPGSSGGPLLNSAGEIIGLNTAIFSQTGSFIGIGFAIPSKVAREIATQIREHGKVVRGWAGLMAQDLDPELAGYFNAHGTRGALVTDVDPEGPAGQAKLAPGDVVKSFAGLAVESADHLKTLVAKAPEGSVVRMTILREGQETEKQLKIRQAPEPRKSSASQRAGQAPPDKTPPDASLGLRVRDIVPELAEHLALPERSGALVVGVQPGSPAFDAGVLPGDVVLKAGDSAVHGAKDLNQALKHSGDHATVLYIQRGDARSNEKLFVPVKKEAA